MKPFRKTKYYSFSLQRFLKWFQHSSPAWFSAVSKPLWWVVPEELLYPSRSWGTCHHTVRGHIAQIKKSPRLIWIQQVLAGMHWPPCHPIFLHLRITFSSMGSVMSFRQLATETADRPNVRKGKLKSWGIPLSRSAHCNAFTIQASLFPLAGRDESSSLAQGIDSGSCRSSPALCLCPGLGRFPCCWPVGTHQQRGCWTSKTRRKCWLMEPCKHWSEQLVNHYYLEVSRKIRTNMKQRWNKQLLYGQKWIFSFHSK